MWMIQFEGDLVTMPFVAPGDPNDWMVPKLTGRFPNSVILEMDEDRFKRGFMDHAEWTIGKGEYASLSYCGGRLTIQRYETLDAAIEAKRGIDGGGCGGGCTKVHFIVRTDPANSRAAKENENIRRYLAEHPEARKRPRAA